MYDQIWPVFHWLSDFNDLCAVFFRKIMKNPELLPQPPLFAPRAVVARSSAAWGLGNGGLYPPFQPFVLLATMAMPRVVWRQPGFHIII